ncbi:MAG: polysaccharide biosynthesis protein [Pseudomonadota bacterium]
MTWDAKADIRIDALERPAPVLSVTAQRHYAGRSILVTGAGGTIGGQLVKRLLALGPRQVLLLDQSEYAMHQLDTALRPLADTAGTALVSRLGSVLDTRLVRRLLQDCSIDTIFHAAAYKHVPVAEANPAVTLENNVIGTEILARAAEAAAVDRMIFVSTDKAVRPAGVMGASKWIAEQVVRDIGARSDRLSTAIARFGNVLGSSGSVWPVFSDQIRRGGPVTITDPQMERYFMHLDEAVNLLLEVGAMSDDGALYYFDMGAPVRVENLARHMIRAAGFAADQIALRYCGARPGEKLREDMTWHGDGAPTAHPQILHIPERALSQIEVAQLLRRLRKAVAEGEGGDVVDWITSAQVFAEAAARQG